MDSCPSPDLDSKQHRRKATMVIADKAVLVTGAGRGLGQALVEEALRRGAKRVYAATRQPFTHPDERVTRVIMDVTDQAQIEAAAERVAPLDILINNAGVSLPDALSDRVALDRHLAVNLFGDLGRDRGVPAVADPERRTDRQHHLA